MNVYVDYSGKAAYAWAAAIQTSTGRVFLIGGPLTHHAGRWDGEEQAYLACRRTLEHLGVRNATYHSDGRVTCMRHGTNEVRGDHPLHHQAHVLSRKIRTLQEGGRPGSRNEQPFIQAENDRCLTRTAALHRRCRALPDSVDARDLAELLRDLDANLTRPRPLRLNQKQLRRFEETLAHLSAELLALERRPAAPLQTTVPGHRLGSDTAHPATPPRRLRLAHATPRPQA